MWAAVVVVFSAWLLLTAAHSAASPALSRHNLIPFEEDLRHIEWKREVVVKTKPTSGHPDSPRALRDPVAASAPAWYSDSGNVNTPQDRCITLGNGNAAQVCVCVEGGGGMRTYVCVRVRA